MINFLAGAGVFAFGVLFGASLVQVSYKRKPGDPTHN